MTQELNKNLIRFSFNSDIAGTDVLKRIMDSVRNPDMTLLEKYEGEYDSVIGPVYDYVLPLCDGYVLCTTGAYPYDSENYMQFDDVRIGRNNDAIEIADADVLLAWQDDDHLIRMMDDKSMAEALCRRMAWGMEEAVAFMEKQAEDNSSVRMDDLVLPRREKNGSAANRSGINDPDPGVAMETRLPLADFDFDF